MTRKKLKKLQKQTKALIVNPFFFFFTSLSLRTPNDRTSIRILITTLSSLQSTVKKFLTHDTRMSCFTNLGLFLSWFIRFDEFTLLACLLCSSFSFNAELAFWVSNFDPLSCLNSLIFDLGEIKIGSWHLYCRFLVLWHWVWLLYSRWMNALILLVRLLQFRT